METVKLTLGSKDTSAIFLNRSIVTEVVSAKLLIPLSYNTCCVMYCTIILYTHITHTHYTHIHRVHTHLVFFQDYTPYGGSCTNAHAVVNHRSTLICSEHAFAHDA